MALDRILFVARLASPDARTLFDRRLEKLARWYGSLGEVRASVRHLDGGSLVLGVIGFDGEDVDLKRPLVWGNELPPALDSAAALLGASHHSLRDLPTPLAAVAAMGERARLITTAGGVATLFVARSDDAVVWSSHAVAAGWLARGQAEVDPFALLELVALEYVGGGASIIAGVHEVPAASSVTLEGAQVKSECFWSPSERWHLVQEREAPRVLEQRMRVALARSLSQARIPVLGLTCGLDSSLVAVMLRELGIGFSAFTFSERPGDDEAIGAQTAAHALGIPHHGALRYEWRDEEGLQRLHAAVRWHEAGAPAWFGSVPWPGEMTHWVTGVGAETGRAFYYKWVRPALAGPPSDRVVEAAFIGPAVAQMVDVEPAQLGRLRARWREWIRQGRAAGLTGWRALDFVYAEQRVRRWGRGMAPRLHSGLVPAYAPAEVLSALSSLPLKDRLNDGFAREFLMRTAPSLAPRMEETPINGVRRVAPVSTIRVTNAIRLARRRVGLRPVVTRSSGEDPRWFERDPWSELPSYIGWITDEVLCSPLLDPAGGGRWRRELREGFLRGEAEPARAAVLAGSAVALQSALGELTSDG